MSDFAEPIMVKFLHDKGAKQGVPVSGTFELTQRCNFNCELCYVHDCEGKADPLSASDWLSLGQQAKAAGTVFLLLTGGEPFLHKDFEEIYIGLVKMGFLVSINTNGSLLHKYIKLFEEYPPSRINISLYGADRSTYKAFCGVDAYNKVLSAIKKVADLGISVKFNSLFTPENISDYKKVIDIAKALSIPVKPTTYAYPPVRLGESKCSARFTPETAAEYIDQIEKYLLDEDYYEKKIEKILSLPKGPDDNKLRCRAGRASFWITADGIMRPCGMMPYPDGKPLTDGFDKAWEDIKAQTQEIRLPTECLTCKYAGICSVCAAMCVAENGEFSKVPEYICRMTKRLYDLAEAFHGDKK